MSSDYAAIRADAADRLAQLRRDGWLESAFADLDATQTAVAADLFTDEARPLVVAFFGGTGVGKSSLLNRLAGRALARTGVERPTSHEATLYLHTTVTLASLPSGMPADRVRIARHDDAALRDIAWIDTPDIDSTAAENRELALACAAYVDLLVYVVSPERYRDDVGWREVRRRAQHCGWAFAINRWDEGDAAQRGDFAGMLHDAGFERPLLFCTICAAPAQAQAPPSADEFPQLREHLAAVQRDHGVQELERLGHAARLRVIAERLIAAKRCIGDAAAWSTLATALSARCSEAQASLCDGAESTIRLIAEDVVARESTATSRVRRLLRDMLPWKHADDAPAPPIRADVWDDWSESRLRSVHDELEIAARRIGVTPTLIRAALERATAPTRERVALATQTRLREALARPGAAWQRALRRVTGPLILFAPFAALLFVAYHIVTRYIRAIGDGGYTDAAFLLHSVLFVAIAWIVPFALHRLLKPNIREVTARALRRALREELDRTRADLAAAFDQTRASAAAECARLDALLSRISGFTSAGAAPGTAVRRLVPVARSTEFSIPVDSDSTSQV